MINEETTKIAIEYLTELRDSRQKVLPNKAPNYEAEKDMDIFNIAIKALHTVEITSQQIETQDKKIEAIIEELESRKSYGVEYAQAMEDVIVILKAQFGIK